jgi:hypothetical protein
MRMIWRPGQGEDEDGRVAHLMGAEKLKRRSRQTFRIVVTVNIWSNFIRSVQLVKCDDTRRLSDSEDFWNVG